MLQRSLLQWHRRGLPWWLFFFRYLWYLCNGTTSSIFPLSASCSNSSTNSWFTSKNYSRNSAGFVFHVQCQQWLARRYVFGWMKPWDYWVSLNFSKYLSIPTRLFLLLPQYLLLVLKPAVFFGYLHNPAGIFPELAFIISRKRRTCTSNEEEMKDNAYTYYFTVTNNRQFVGGNWLTVNNPQRGCKNNTATIAIALLQLLRIFLRTTW